VSTADNVNPEPRPKKGFEEMINELIIQRKLQQEALFKIKASVTKKRPGGGSVDNSALEKNESPINSN
jgi:hypothetical protein